MMRIPERSHAVADKEYLAPGNGDIILSSVDSKLCFR